MTVTVVASLGVHFVALRAAPLLASQTRTPPPAEDLVLFELSVRADEASAPKAVVSEPASRAAPDRRSARVAAASRSPAAPKPRSPVRLEGVAPEAEVESSTTQPRVAPSEPTRSPPSSRDVARLDLSPRAAAATLAGEFGAGDENRCRALRLADPDAGCSGSGVGEAGEGPKAAGRASAERTLLPHDFPLKRERGGGYVYKTFGFEAHIEPDGQVRFVDKIRDLNGLVSSLAGEYQNATRKRSFNEQTAGLRAHLSQKFIAEAQARGLVDLRRELASILGRSLAPARKREAVFALWDDCAGDALGKEAQEVIEAFIRARMPQDGPLAFSVAELKALNRRRISGRPFDPYAVGG